jgi:hypothetical protein
VNSPLPEASFAELAFDLRVIARSEAGAIENLEYFIARLGDEASPSIKSVLAGSRAQAARIAQLVHFLEALAEREDDVRALFQPALKEELKHAV